MVHITALVAFAALAAGVVAEDDSYTVLNASSPLRISQCNAVQFQWTGGIPPYQA